jgi:hypothetical protein
MEEEKPIKFYKTLEPDYVKNYNKNYYSTNKDTVLQKMGEKMPCNNCGCLVSKCHLPRHKRSNKCQNIVKKNNTKDTV